MHMSKKLTISLIVGGLISTLTLYLAFRNVPANDLMRYIRTIDYWWILPTVSILMLTFVIRVLRWKLILGGICELTFWQAFHPLMIGFMMNCVLPGRVGELARPVLLKQKHRVPMTTGFSTVAAERIFDLFSLIALFAVVFPSVAGKIGLDGGQYFGIHLDGEMLESIAAGMVRLSIAMVVFIALLTIDPCRNAIKKVIATTGAWTSRLLPGIGRYTDRIFNLLQRIMDNFAIGLSLVRNPVRLVYCAALTFVIWALTALSYLVFAIGCPGISLSLWDFTTVMVIICFVIALPSVPGFWGLWEAGGVFALSMFGIAEKDALGFTLVNHAVQLFPVIGLGLISALITSVNILQLSQTESDEASQPVPEGK